MRIATCLLVSKILVADGIITDGERALLDDVMLRKGLTPEEKRKVFDLEGWDEAEAVVAQLPEDDRREIMSELVDAASADGRISPLELAALKEITRALGLDPPAA